MSNWTSCVLLMESSGIKSSRAPINRQSGIAHVEIMFMNYERKNCKPLLQMTGAAGRYFLSEKCYDYVPPTTQCCCVLMQVT